MSPLAASYRLSIALALAGALAGCDLFGPAKPARVALPKLSIPAARTAERAQKIDDALAVYPSTELVPRDPFLSSAEEFSLRTGAPAPEAPIATPLPVAPRRRKNLDGLEAIEGEVNLIVFGERDGRRTAVWRGRVLQEGQKVGDYRVMRVDDSGIELQEADGTGRRSLRFKRNAASVWQN
jgi:hypothetical protein